MSPGFESDRLSLADAMLPSSTLPASRMGVYVEVYGGEDGEIMDLRMSLEKTERSVFGRLGALLGLGSDAAIQVAWSETVDLADERYVPLFVVVDVSALKSGEYTLSVGVEADTDRRAAASRPIRVVLPRR